MQRPATRVIDPATGIVRQSGRGRFLVVKGPDRGESFAVGNKAMTFGSGGASDVRLTDPTISRRHLSAERQEEGVVVRDLGSTNGSYVQGARFQELLIGFGAEVHIGQTVLKYVPEEEMVDVDPSEEESFGSLLGRDPKLRKMFSLLGDVATTEATILIEGETGTGKELIAEEIHRHSGRAKGPFVVFDCGAVPSDLIESALFGHVKGAFTGAIADRPGAFLEADGGTLFLDEIGELGIELQPALLRALDKRTVRPVGGTTTRKVSVRVVAATNRNLRAEVTARRFREDLYYRLAVIRIGVPPLRNRASDIPLLVEHFVGDLGGGRNLQIGDADMRRLQQHTWPGNVRELRNVIERSCALSKGTTLELDEMFAEGATPPPMSASFALNMPFKEAKQRVIDTFERDYIRALVGRHSGNLSAAAREAEIDRKHLRELMRKHGLRDEPHES